MTEYKYKDEVFTTGTREEFIINGPETAEAIAKAKQAYEDWIKTDGDKDDVAKGETQKNCLDIVQVFDILMDGFQHGAYEHSDITNLFADFLEDTLVTHEVPEAERVKLKAAAQALLDLADIKLPFEDYLKPMEKH